MYFKNRVDAGRQLAALLRKFRGRDGAVYALPRGGVPLGAEIARELGLPLDIVTARKIGHPESPEYAIGAVTEGGELAVNPLEVEHLDKRWFDRAVAAQREEAQHRRKAYYGERTRPDVAGKLAIVVDDGIATGLTMEAALLELRQYRPGHLVMAVPVAPADTADRLAHLVDEFIAVETPVDYLGAVGAYYADFEQVSDAEVIALLDEANRPRGAPKDRE